MSMADVSALDVIKSTKPEQQQQRPLSTANLGRASMNTDAHWNSSNFETAIDDTESYMTAADQLPGDAAEKPILDRESNMLGPEGDEQSNASAPKPTTPSKSVEAIPTQRIPAKPVAA